jgi:hypothetical protein
MNTDERVYWSVGLFLALPSLAAILFGYFWMGMHIGWWLLPLLIADAALAIGMFMWLGSDDY